MKTEFITKKTVYDFLKKEIVSTLPKLKKELGTTSTMTVFRKLKELGYISSYSHRGQYYTLVQVAKFNKSGLWCYDSVWFSQFGNLIKTIRYFIQKSKGGYTALELQERLHAEVNGPLRLLFKEEQINREKVSGVYVYFTNNKNKMKQQYLVRKSYKGNIEIGISPKIKILSPELMAGIVLFFSMLDEKQKRLYAGLESQKLGYGGDNKIGELLGLDIHTVSRGREDLFGANPDVKDIRVKGGGRKPIEKKLRK